MRFVITTSASVTYRLAVAHAFSGVSGTRAVAVGAGTSATPGTATMTASSGDALYAVTVYNSGTVRHAPVSGLTELVEFAAGTKSLAVDHLVVTQAGAVADSGSLTASVLWTDSAVLLR